MTRSPGSAANVRRLPRVRVVPRAGETEGDLACELAAGYGLTPDDWQQDVLEDWLLRQRRGRWSSATCWLAVPRQNGKNACIEVRELYGMVELGERFLHTAHEVKTSRRAFKRLLGFFDNPRKYPDLAAMVTEVRKTNGQEAIFLDNGGSVEVIARSRSSGRGFDGIDVLVCDEAQELTDEEQAALLPTISAAHLGNPQVIFTGTPPDPDKPTQGTVFRRVRTDGLSRRDPRLCLHDFGVEDGPLPDVDDMDLWHQVNPALGGRLNLAEVKRERSLMSPAKFAAERLGWWGDPDTESAGVIDLGVWAKLEGKAAEPSTAVLVVDVSPDRRSSSIGVAADQDGKTLVMVRHGAGTAWVPAEVRKLVDRHTIRDVAVVAGQADTLTPDIESAGVEVERITVTELGAACGAFLAGIGERRYVHVGQPELDRAVSNARTRRRGEAEIWDRRDWNGPDISPLVACSAAAFRWAKNAEREYDLEMSVG